MINVTGEKETGQLSMCREIKHMTEQKVTNLSLQSPAPSTKIASRCPLHVCKDRHSHIKSYPNISLKLWNKPYYAFSPLNSQRGARLSLQFSHSPDERRSRTRRTDEFSWWLRHFLPKQTLKERRETPCVLSQYKSMLLMFSAAAAA